MKCLIALEQKDSSPSDFDGLDISLQILIYSSIDFDLASQSIIIVSTD